MGVEMSVFNMYFVIYSNTSRYSLAGLQPQVGWSYNKKIIEAAALEMNRSGETLEDLAGVEWIEDADGNMQPTRRLTQDEVLDLSIEKLGDDGRLYSTFNTDDAGAAAFIETASRYGLDEQARDLVEEFTS
jgi:hypothetical protein